MPIRQGLLAVGAGFLAQVLAKALFIYGQHGTGLALGLAGVALCVWGCARYAGAKGYSAWYGAFGMLSLAGLIALFLLRDRRGRGARAGTPAAPNG